MIADKGSKGIVNGNIKAPPVVGPNPGNTPNIKPINVPKKRMIKSFILNNGANIYIKFSIYYP
jgi:hypothetical protein